MNKVIRVIISVPLAIVVTILLATLLTMMAPLSETGSVSKGQRETAFALSIFITILPALLTGILIPVLNLRPLKGAIVGAAMQMILLVLIVLAAIRDLYPLLLLTAAWAFAYGISGAVAGFLCGLLSPRTKPAEEKYP